jgi:hypothetical protein
MTDTELTQARALAAAEVAYGATGKTDSPFAGSAQKLRDLEAQQEQMAARQQGEVLLAAMDEVKSINAQLAHLSIRHQAAVQTMKDAAFHPAVHRYKAAPALARDIGLGHMWACVSDFIASDRPWTSAPIQASALKAPDIPDGLKFSEQDRAAILAFREAQTTVGRLEQEVQSAESRRNAILQNHPALQSLTI